MNFAACNGVALKFVAILDGFERYQFRTELFDACMVSRYADK